MACWGRNIRSVEPHQDIQHTSLLGKIRYYDKEQHKAYELVSLPNAIELIFAHVFRQKSKDIYSSSLLARNLVLEEVGR